MIDIHLKRADELRLGDYVIVATWNGIPKIEYVASLDLEGDDVVVNDATTTSRSNMFDVVIVDEAK